MNRCPLCTHDAPELLAKLPASITSESKPLAGATTLHLCPKCGHLFSHADVDWDTYYSQQYDATLTDDGLDELVVHPNGSTTFRTDFDYSLFRRMVGEDLHGAARVLEFGCGRGRILSRLKKDGYRRVWACDVSERYRAGAARLIGDAHVSIGSIPSGPFHVIASFFVFEHAVDPLASLCALRERLSDGGTLFVMVPNWRTNVGDLACADHVHHFSIESVHMMFAAAGLGITGMDLSAQGTVAVTAKRAEHASGFARPGVWPTDSSTVGRPDDSAKPDIDPGFDNPRLAEANRTGTRQFLQTLARLEQLPARLEPHRRVFLYGAGFYAALAGAFVPHIDGIFDANPKKQGLERLGHTVAAPSSINKNAHGDDALVVCVNARSAQSIADQYRNSFNAVFTL